MSSALAPGGKARRTRKAPPYRLTMPVVREWPLQKQINDVFTTEIARAGHVSRHGVIWFSVDISSYGGEVPGARIGRGVVAGIPDVWILHAGRAYMLEVKSDDGVLSSVQREMAVALLTARCHYAVVRDCDEAIAALDAWSIPRARRTHISPRCAA